MDELPKKYNDEDTKKPGSPIETPYKYSDIRRKLVIAISEEVENDESSINE